MFLSPDTVVPDPSAVIDYNRFLYARGNPLKYADPSGHCPFCILIGIGVVAFLARSSTAPIPAGSYSRNPGANLPPYRQGAAEVRQNRATIQSLASDRVPGILLAASIANQGNTCQCPFGWDGGEIVQSFVDPDPSVGIGQIRPGEAKGLGYEGWTVGLLDDTTSIGLMAAKLQKTADVVGKLGLDPTESFMLMAIGNNIGKSAAKRYGSYKSMADFLKGDAEARTQLLKMMNWTEYLQAKEGWSPPEDVDTNRIWGMLQDAYE
jgi:hypothetical protein